MHSGDVALTTAIYRTECDCHVEKEIARATSVPPCPECRKAVTWVFRRSTFRPPSSAGEEWRPPRAAAAGQDPDVKPAPHEGVPRAT